MNGTHNQAKKNRQLGKLGERLALQFLVKKDYSLVARNYQGHWGELDLIMKKDQRFIFIEVKTRKNPNFGSGEEAVDHFKKRKLLRAIHQFMENNKVANMPIKSPPEQEWQLDLVAIDFIGFNLAKIRHFENILGAG